jgi:myo-inositol-1(or 4)-monophosphatase
VTTAAPHSGIAMALLDGEKRLSAIVHDNNKKNVKQGPWDTAAPQVIVEEAGGVFLNGLSGATYNPLDPAIIVIASNPSIAHEIIQLIAQAKPN